MHVYRRALAYYKKDKGLVALLLVLIALSSGLLLLSAWPTAILVDAVLTPTPHFNSIFHKLLLWPFPKDNKLAQVIGVTLIGMFIKITLDTIGMIRVMINNKLKYNGVARARGQLYNKLQDLDATYHKKHPQGDSIFRVSNDVLGIFGILDTFVGVGVAVVNLSLFILTLYSRNRSLTALSLTITPLMIFSSWHFGRTIKRRTAESRQIDADFTTVLQRSLSSMMLIQLFGRQRESRKRFYGATSRAVNAWMRMNWQEQLYPWTVNVIYALGGAIIFGYGGYLVWRDTIATQAANPFTLGEVMVFMVYLGNLWDPLNTITGFRARISGHVAMSERVFEVLDRPSFVTDPKHPTPLELKPRALELRDVQFAYRPDAPVLRGVAARIEPGEMVAFLGESGAGKSTLLNLLPRFYDPTAGAVLLDDIDLRDVRVADVRKHVALVTQDAPMLATTIAENIAFGRPEATYGDIRVAAKRAGADEFISALPDGYDTLIDENGGNLSGGQKQRVAIARALLTNAPILVLDEPTSALDDRQEKHIMKTLADMRGERTIIIVTHRVDTIGEADRVFVLDKGRITQTKSSKRSAIEAAA